MNEVFRARGPDLFGINLPGAHVLSVWNEHCSYLVMNKVEMTHKLLHALIDQRDFILPSFIDSIRSRPLLQVNGVSLWLSA